MRNRYRRDTPCFVNCCGGAVASARLMHVPGVDAIQAVARDALAQLHVLRAHSVVTRWRAGVRLAVLAMVAFLCLALLLVAPALYLTQSFLAIGDPTPANVAIALLTGMLPIALVVAGAHCVRAGLGAFTARLDLLALAGALQWCVVLAAWGMLPFALWR